MNISVNNLDLGYEQCSELNSLINTEGEELLVALASNINSLKEHWIGSDASRHINNLIVVYKALHALLSQAQEVSAGAGERIIAIQQVRNANGGGGNVGSPLTKGGLNFSSIAECSPTNEYFVDPAAKTDYANLERECSEYSSFMAKFNSKKDDLLGNWTAGANREQAVSNFNEFESNSGEYNKYLTDAKENLEMAVSNIAQL